MKRFAVACVALMLIATSAFAELGVSVTSVDVTSFPTIYLGFSAVDENSDPITTLSVLDVTLSENSSGVWPFSMSNQGSGNYLLFYTTSNESSNGATRPLHLEVDFNGVRGSADTSYTEPGGVESISLSVPGVATDQFPALYTAVTVLDQNNDVIEGLNESNFTITEDGIPQPNLSVTWSGVENYLIMFGTPDPDSTGLERTVQFTVTYNDLNASDDATYTAPSPAPRLYLDVTAVDSSAFPDIQVTVQVADVNESLIEGLTESDFSLTEDDVAQSPLTVSELEAGIYEVDYTTSNVDSNETVRTVSVTASNSTLSGRTEASYTAPALSPQRHISITGFDSTLFPDMEVTVSVTDENDNAVSGLDLSHFDLSEDEAGQTLASVTPDNDSYILAYRTSNWTRDGGSRAVQVSVNHSGLSATDGSSYTAAIPPSLIIGDVSVVVGDSAFVPVTVSDFTDVNVLELFIDFKSQLLDFGRMTSDVLDAPVYNDADSTFIVTWSSLDELNLTDGDTLFMMHFGTDNLPLGFTTPLAWSDEDTSFIANQNYHLFEGITYTDGSVTGLNTFLVSGALSYHANELNLEGVTVALSGDTTLTTMTDSDGLYSFEDIRAGDYVISPSLSENEATGVSTLDAYRIQTHVASIDPFPTGYYHLSADVDGGATINTTDAYKVQRVVVGLDDGFEAGDWLFVNSDYAIAGDNWTEADLERSISLTTLDSVNQDFYGVRVGDANGTWPSRFLAGPSKTDDITGSLTIAEANVRPGETVTVDVRAEGLFDLGVIEWHMAFDPTVVTLQDVDLHELPGAVVASTDSTLSVSWYNIQVPLNCEDRTLASLTFEAAYENNVQSDLLFTRVILGDGEGQPVWTEENGGSILVSDLADVEGPGAELVTDWVQRPAYPNPFNASTTVSFDLKETGNVRIQVYNLLGDLVATLVDGNMAKGRYASSINAQTWSSGTYFVVMKTSGFNKVQKIVLLK